MKRVVTAIAASTAALAMIAVVACNRPTEDKCRKAVDNIMRITGLDKQQGGPDTNAAIRSCQATASADAVNCMIDAKTLDDLAKCEGDVANKLFKDEGNKDNKDNKDNEGGDQGGGEGGDPGGKDSESGAPTN